MYSSQFFSLFKKVFETTPLFVQTSITTPQRILSKGWSELKILKVQFAIIKLEYYTLKLFIY